MAVKELVNGLELLVRRHMRRKGIVMGTGIALAALITMHTLCVLAMKQQTYLLIRDRRINLDYKIKQYRIKLDHKG